MAESATILDNTLTAEIDALDEESPETILRWAADRFAPDVVLTCSFQHDGVVLAHMLRGIASWVPVLFIDTGFHFAETLEYRDQVVRKFDLNLRVLEPALPREEFARRHGLDLYARNPDLCCSINKVEPLRQALDGVRCWINGRRRDQGPTRSGLRVAEEYEGGLVKVNPLASWTARDTWHYMQAHDIPEHPLSVRGYASIGCEPCTRPILPGENERSGRWAGSTKTECGIHTFLKKKG